VSPSGLRIARRRRPEVRDADEAELYRKMLTVRAIVESAAGKGKSAQLVGLDPRLSKVDGQTLRRYARSALEALERRLEPFEHGTDVVRGLERLDAGADHAAHRRLEVGVLESLELQQRRVEETQRLKDEALARLRLVAVNGAKILEGFYNLAGEKFHAERLRRKRGRAQASSPEEPGEPAPEPTSVE